MRRVAVVAGVVSLLAAVAVAPRAAGAERPAGAYAFCPAAKPALTASLTWSHHRLAAGVTLAETTAHDSGGRVVIHVVRADLSAGGVSVRPLYRTLSHRHTLTALGSRTGLVAATNGMYFSFGYGAPVVPFVANGRPVVLTSTPQPVAGIGTDGRAEDGTVALAGSVSLVGATVGQPTPPPLTAVNAVSPPGGLAVYTPTWGTGAVPMPAGAASRLVADGQVASAIGHRKHLTGGDELLVARGGAAVQWLRSLATGTQLHIATAVTTDAAVPFQQAYGTGTQVVAEQGQVRTDLYCRRGAVLVARTTIGWNADGTQLTLVTVEGGVAKHQHGLDENQMSALLVSLGVSRAYALDGGGSTELVTRLAAHHRVTPRTRVTGRQRLIPVGVGVFAG